MENMTSCPAASDWPGALVMLGFLAFVGFVFWLLYRDEDK